jgi:hypothetical protein
LMIGRRLGEGAARGEDEHGAQKKHCPFAG